MTENPEQAQLKLQSPGQILKEAREKKQLDQSAIGKLLHLHTDIVNIIENDEYEKISAPTYTRGYLRSYAKVVDVDDESLIELYNNTLKHNDDPEIIPEVSQKSQVTSSDKPVKIVTYLITFALMILLLVWWQSKYLVQDTSIAESENVEEELLDSNKVKPAFTYDFSVVEHPDTPSAFDDSSPTSTDDVSGGELTDSLNRNVSEDHITIDTNNSTGETGKLRLIVSQESWIEVYNINDRRLFHKLALPGSTINITGLIPLSVLIGNAEGVEVEYNNEVIDTLPFTRANVARLTLGE